MSAPKRVSMKDVARKAGVSVNTVSLALRNDPRLTEPTRRLVQDWARTLGYVSDPVMAAGMARLRGRLRRDGFGGVLGVVHICERAQLERWAVLRSQIEGVELRARELGYQVEFFPLIDEPKAGERLGRALRARGVPGVIFAGPWLEREQPVALELAKGFACVSCGPRFSRPAIHGVMADHFMGVRFGVRMALERGYRRPGLVLSDWFDASLERRIQGGFAAAMTEVAPADQLPVLWFDVRDTAAGRRQVEAWSRQWCPDVILTYAKLQSVDWWNRRQAPGREVGLVQLGWTEETPEWAGVGFPGVEVGKAAVDLAVAQIHRGERGVPAYQKCVLIEGSWREGGTLRRKAGG